MKNVVIVFILFLLSSFNFLSAQSVVISEDYSVSQLMDKYININNSTNRINGWRIQIIATTDRSKLESVKRKFMERYPEISIDWIHAKPYYKLRAGAFISKLDATRLLHRLKNYYPSAYLTKDNKIKPTELIGL